jgi:putative inorganic carbon (hco3(-)) transporter
LTARLPARPLAALVLVALAAALAESVVAWGPLGAYVPQPRTTMFLVIGCVVAAVALANDPAWSISGALAASMFSGNWGQLGLPLPVDRLLFALGVAGVLVRMPIQRPRVRLGFVHVAIVAAALFVIVSAYLSGTLRTHEGMFALLDKYGLVPFLSFLLAPVVFDTPSRRAVLVGVLTVCGAYLGITALAEATHARGLVWPSYILDAHVGITADRARGPFAESGAMGLGLWGCGVAALTYVAVRAQARPWQRTAALIVAGLCVLGLVFTLTRAIWAGAAISALLTLVLARDLRPLLLPAIVACSLLVAGALVTVPGLRQQVQKRQEQQSSVWDRYNSNAAALRMLEARPLTGFGWARFKETSTPYYRLAFTYPLTSVGEVHNVFLSNAAELGVFGTFLWLVALVVAVGVPLVRAPPPGMRPWRNGLLAIAVMWFAVANFAPLANVFPNMLLWTWAGLLWVRSDGTPPVSEVARP